MKKELEKIYDPHIVEDRIYGEWLRRRYFHAKPDKAKKPYTIVIPPPNITGQLHMGHALNGTIQDILIRFKRMQGYNALWLPGTDHASISTEVKVVEKMASEGISKEAIGREGFLEKAWAWRDEYGSRIVEQFKKLGSSCDWDRERFTLDSNLSKAVTEVFVRLYEKGYIYRSEKLINWCPMCQTTISDAEVDHEDMQGDFYHFKYKIVGTDDYICFATTRPETMLGDTAVAVNPEDERYVDYVGKKVIVPIVNREIPIIADHYVEKDFGTGVVKITPAHDPNDFEVGQRHNLPVINIMNDDGTLNENAAAYEGMDKIAARERIVNEFKLLGLYVKTEKINHAVGVHERCKNVIEPLIKLQWFVKMEEMAKPAIEANLNGELRIIPDRFSKVYLNWLQNIRDWCISRQLWWGHRIPAYYCAKCGHVEVARTSPDKCSMCGHTKLNQDEDVLDTWFSSALWPFSTLGWPDKTEDLEYFYPTNVLVTAYDIIFFWVIRMVFSGIEQTGKLPFKDVFIHGLVRDSQGRKMSKTLGNGVDPLEVIEKYGTDALRLTLITGNSPGNDSRFYYEKVDSSRSFANKIWNAARFILMNMENEENKPDINQLTAADKWILSKVNNLAKEVTDNLDNYELGMAAQKIYDFIWDEFCDWYIEMVKPRLYNEEDATRATALWTLKNVLIDALKLLHPFMPFITEEIFAAMQDDEETIMLSKWPEFSKEYSFDKEEKEIELLKESVRGIRNIRAQMNVPYSRKAKAFIVSANKEVLDIFNRGQSFFKTLAYAGDISLQSDNQGVPSDAVSVVVPDAVIYIPFAELVDIEKEVARLLKERKKYEAEVERIDNKLSNEGFVKKAPPNIISEEKEKRQKYQSMLEQINEQINVVSYAAKSV